MEALWVLVAGVVLYFVIKFVSESHEAKFKQERESNLRHEEHTSRLDKLESND